MKLSAEIEQINREIEQLSQLRAKLEKQMKDFNESH